MFLLATKRQAISKPQQFRLLHHFNPKEATGDLLQLVEVLGVMGKTARNPIAARKTSHEKKNKNKVPRNVAKMVVEVVQCTTCTTAGNVEPMDWSSSPLTPSPTPMVDEGAEAMEVDKSVEAMEVENEVEAMEVDEPHRFFAKIRHKTFKTRQRVKLVSKTLHTQSILLCSISCNLKNKWRPAA